MPDPSTSLILRALDPSRSVVVEACAGSGKTWLLASRIVRLLLAGVAPSEILAITFTRKAAREIEERVVDWLHQLATTNETQVGSFLEERGVVANAMARHAARGLYERVLAAQPGLTVNTFHGWFLQLVDAAPLSANLAGVVLAESGSRLFEELWQSFAADLQKTPESEPAQCFVRLLDQAGLESSRRLIRRAFERRSEWLAIGGEASAIAESVLASLQSQLGIGASGEALTHFFAGDWQVDFQAYLGLLEMSTLKSDQEAATVLGSALTESDRAVCFDSIRSLLLTRENTVRVKKRTDALDKRYTPAGAERFLALHGQLGEQVLECLEKQTAECILAFNRDACTAFAAFLAHVESFKRARRQIDFVDAEWKVLQLLRDEATAAFVQARLDARYRHVLLDEFQDTNPLQWQILCAWLDAYSDASRPGVFLVGDPKQSIYRFRRAEPRLFSVAADFLVREYGAVRCEQDATRRNARPVIDVVNALFLDEAAFAPFREQSTFVDELPGRVELLPLFGKDEIGDVPVREGLRNPLTEPALEPEDLRRRREAEALTAKIGEIVGDSGNHRGDAWQISAKNSDGTSVQRAACYGDILLLVRTRNGLAVYERALSAAGIPFDAGSRGGLLAALEVRDIQALLEFLVTPVDDLKLAHVLRSPVFACSDEELMLLAACDESTWWQRLKALAQNDGATPRLTRAAQLLSEWLQTADRLPAHDLLDRIFHQGEVLSRYRLAVPEAAVESAIANLNALLLLALDLDGGRYPSLPRFIDELRELRDVDANDAPDEGVIETRHVDAGRVRILTIHGAKGLEAPIVWLLGANAAPRVQEAWDVLVDWPPEALAPQHFSFFGRREERGAARQPMFDAEAVAARREELNLLYVAITRARQVFIASGIENDRAGEGTPYRLLESALGKLGDGLAHGDMPLVAAFAVHSSRAVARASLPLPPVGERQRMPDAAERFGLLLHALMERRTGDGETDGWWKEQGFEDGEYRRVQPVADRLLSASGLRHFFDPACYRRAWNEVDLKGVDGRLLRIDRLVEFEDMLWVLDYKGSASGSARIDEYRDQVCGYCRAVEGVFGGKTVRGMLIFADASSIEIY